MTKRPKIRQLFGKGRRSLLAGLLALWVSLGIQPCAIASVSDADCPHCPPEASAHAMAMDEHCGDGAQPSSTAYAADCCDADNSVIETRSKNVDVKPDVDLATGPPPDPWHQVDSRPLQMALVDPAGRRSPAIALHKLYCVYLD